MRKREHVSHVIVWMPLSALPAGKIFMSTLGVMAVKTSFEADETKTYCVLLSDGTHSAVPNDEAVTPMLLQELPTGRR